MKTILVQYVIDVKLEKAMALEEAVSKLGVYIQSRNIFGSGKARSPSRPEVDLRRKPKHFPSDEEVVAVYKSKKSASWLASHYDMTPGTIRRIKAATASRHRRALSEAGLLITKTG